MMGKGLPLVIPDADVIIHLLEFGLWETIISQFRVQVPTTVAKKEVTHYSPQHDPSSKKYIDLTTETRIEMIDPGVDDLTTTKSQIDRFSTTREIHDGEFYCISAVYTDPSSESLLCLKDAAAIYVSVLIGLKERLLSIEALLQKCSLKIPLPYPLSEKRFSKIVQEAEAERIQKL